MTPIELTCDTSVTEFITGHTYIVTDFIATTDEKYMALKHANIHTHHKTIQTHISSTIITPFHISMTLTTLMKWKIDNKNLINCPYFTLIIKNCQYINLSHI